MRTEGLELLLERRGKEKVTFQDVVDHMADYLDRYPNEEHAVDNVAKFLAGVEDVKHDHDARDVGSDV
jgi:hypothetical protein